MEAHSVPPAWLEAHVPHFMREAHLFGVALWQWVGLGVSLLLALVVGYLLAGLVLSAAGRITRQTKAGWDDALVTSLRTPVRAVAFLLVFQAGLSTLALTAEPRAFIRQVLSALWIAVLGIFLFRMITFGSNVVEVILVRQSTNEVDKRGAHTLVIVLRRVALVLVAVLVAALELTRFEVVRTVGVSLLASAGVAGIVIGLAAQRSISSLLAGIQLAVTQPVRVGDSVVVEKEFGTVEEISLTFVVIRIWDDRRLVVPIGYFLEKPFENWTRTGTELLGTVELPADHSVPIDDVRKHFASFLATQSTWDKRASSLQVTGATERTITLRALVSAANAGDLFDLRCAVREELVRYIRSIDDGKHLPRVRMDAPAGTDAPPVT